MRPSSPDVVSLRVIQVDQRHVELAGFERGEHACRRRGGLELESLGLEQQPQRLQHVGLIVGDEHARLGRTAGVSLGGVAVFEVVA